MATALFRLMPPDAQWGDYGRILVHGMAARLPRTAEGFVQLERTGPYIPPMTFPSGAIIVTDRFRSELTTSGLTGFSFKPVVKRCIVELHWEEWDRSRGDPEHYPRGGEPEDHILRGEHSESTSNALGPLWELQPTGKAMISKPRKRLRVVHSSWNGSDIAESEPLCFTIVSDKARQWLSNAIPNLVKFESVDLD